MPTQACAPGSMNCSASGAAVPGAAPSSGMRATGSARAGRATFRVRAASAIVVPCTSSGKASTITNATSNS
ncbi:MAG: hypothetical protein U5L03_05150 [Burkholderiaceae bacterium]|nr:hypothetical protein [Burkholderiaceae bacterium]